MMKRFLITSILAAMCVAFVPISPAAAAILPGDVIRRHDIDTVYYVAPNGERYAFPHFKIYDSWYTNFNRVKFVDEATLAAVPFGGVVFARPGTSMIKIETDPRVYAVGASGSLRWVKTEDVAQAIYGPEWNKNVIDLSPAFFAQYIVGVEIDQADDYDVNFEKHLAGEPYYILDRTGSASPTYEPKALWTGVPNEIATNNGFVATLTSATGTAARKMLLAAGDDIFARCEKQSSCSGIAGPFTSPGIRAVRGYSCDFHGNCKRFLLGTVDVTETASSPILSFTFATTTNLDPIRQTIHLQITGGDVNEIGIIRASGPTHFCMNQSVCDVDTPSLVHDTFTYQGFACDYAHQCIFSNPTTVGPF